MGYLYKWFIYFNKILPKPLIIKILNKQSIRKEYAKVTVKKYIKKLTIYLLYKLFPLNI